MPVDVVRRYTEWKIKYDQDIAKMKQESLANLSI